MTKDKTKLTRALQVLRWACTGDHLKVENCEDCPEKLTCDLSPTWIDASEEPEND